MKFTQETTRGFDRFAGKAIKRWAELALDFPTFGKETYVLFFELMKENPIREMRKFLDYLDIQGEFEEEERLKCLGRHVEGNFHRHAKSSGGRSSPFDLYPEFIKIYSSAIDQVNDELQRLTGQTLPTHLYDYYEPQTDLPIIERFNLRELFDPNYYDTYHQNLCV